MAATRLSLRLVGVTAVCLVALMAPIANSQRIGLLTAFALGVAGASLVPALDRWSPWLVGPCVLVLALVPPAGPWSLAALGAVLFLGLACFSCTGMERAVPALGLALFTIAFRTGQALSDPLLMAWLVAVVAMVILANRASPVERGGRLGASAGLEADGSADLVFGWRRSLQALVVMIVAVPVATVGSGVLLTRLDIGVGAAVDGAATVEGRPMLSHPGLSGGLDIGTPVILDDEVVLRVKAPRPRYWRGTTYDLWDGRYWTSGSEPEPVAWSTQPVDLGPDPALPGAGVPSRGPVVTLPEPVIETQEFTTTRSGFDVIVGAWRMTSLDTTIRSALVGDDGSVSLFSPLPAGATWTVTSEVVPVVADDLRRADPVTLPADSAFMERFAREDDVTPEVTALAREITAGSATTYDRVVALEAWVEANITYTREIGPLPAGTDAVHHLVLESRRGYCEQIASALVVMLRSLGVPARVVVGYVPGSYDGDRGEWVSRGTDAHAWTEVYFPGVGWQGFDPTAGVPLGPESPEEPQTAILGFTLPTGAPAPIVSLVLVASAAVALVGGLAGLRLLRRPRGRPAPGDVPARLADLQRDFDRCGARLGLGWLASTTIREKAQDLRRAEVAPGLVDTAAEALEKAWFGGAARPGPVPVDLVGVTRAVVELDEAVKLRTGTGPTDRLSPGSGAGGDPGRRRRRGSSAARRGRASRSIPFRSPDR